MKNTPEQLFVIVPPGLEQICAKELKQLTNAPLTVTHGGISFIGKLNEIYSTNLWLRCASRILVRLDNFKCRDFPTLFNKASRLSWGRFIQPNQAATIRVSCRESRLIHSDRIADTIDEAINKAMGRKAGDTDKCQPLQTIYARLEDDICTISIDSSGELLHKRGYRQKTTAAPLRETIAAACLMQCNWHGEKPLWDPFCGSGTIPIEGALLAANIPPGMQRNFAFMNWPGFRKGLWQTIIIAANKNRQTIDYQINGSDINEQALAAAQENAKHAGVAEMINFTQGDALTAQPENEQGMLICNPPYGIRLATDNTPVKILAKMHQQLNSNYPTWQGWAILPINHNLPQIIPTTEQLTFSNGGIDVALHKI